MPRLPNSELPEACAAGVVLEFRPLIPEKRFEDLASFCPCVCGGGAKAGVVGPALGVDELSPDLSCGLLTAPKSPPLGCVEALPPKRFDPVLLVEAPKRFIDGGAAVAAELNPAGFVELKRPPDEG